MAFRHSSLEVSVHGFGFSDPHSDSGTPEGQPDPVQPVIPRAGGGRGHSNLFSQKVRLIFDNEAERVCGASW